MERRGAEVVSFEAESGLNWDHVPQAEAVGEWDHRYELSVEANLREKNGYWYAHRALGSRARAYYGNIYDLPDELGRFDVAMFGTVLSHLRDPFQALHAAARLCTDTMIVTNPMFHSDKRPIALFMPTREKGGYRSWWAFSAPCIIRMLEVLGFDVVRTVELEAIRMSDDEKVACTSIVAQRVVPLPA